MTDKMPEVIWAQDISVRWIPTWSSIERTDYDEKEWGIKYHPYILKSTHEKTVQENIRLREALEKIAKPALGGKLQQQIARAALAVGEKGNG